MRAQIRAQLPRALVVGSGIIGLKCAEALQELHWAVTVIHDQNLLETTSALAAGYIEPVLLGSGKADVINRFKRSYPAWMQEAGQRTDACAIRRSRTYSKYPDLDIPLWAQPGQGFVQGFELIDPNEMPLAYASGSGWSYRTVVVQPDLYLPQLQGELGRESNGRPPVIFQKEHVSRISQIVGRADVVIDATSAWSNVIFKDQSFFGKAGRLLHYESIPGLEECSADWSADLSYVFPQRSRIVVGGTSEAIDHPDPRTWTISRQDGEWVRMQRRAEALEPRLIGHRPVARTAGIRPYRDPARIELETVEGQPIVHAVGIGGAGWTLAPAIASEVAELASKAIDLDVNFGAFPEIGGVTA